MLWLIYALSSAFISGINKIFHRVIMLKEDTMSYACLFQFFGALFFIPLLIKEFVLPSLIFPWILVGIAGGLWALETFVAFEAYTHVPVSVRSPIDETRVVFLLVLSVLILSESLFIEKILGTLLIFAGVVMLTYERKRLLTNLTNKGIKFVFLSAFLFALTSIVDKTALNYFTAGTYGFLMFFVPGIILTPFLRKKKYEVKKLLKGSGIIMLISALFSILAYYFRLKAFSLAEVSLVFPITRLSVLIGVLSGILFLKERKHVWRKLIAAIIVIIGASLIAGAFNF